MKYFFDTEFHEHNYNFLSGGKYHAVNTIDLISIGIVREDGESLYLIANDFDIKKAYANEWLRENVLNQILGELAVNLFVAPVEMDLRLLELILFKCGKDREQIKNEILAFISGDETPEFYAYYADYDWVVFCWLFGRMIDLPKGFPMYCRDLKQTLDENIGEGARFVRRGSEVFYTQETIKTHPNYPKQENEHNALDDAKWNKSLYEFIQNL